MTARLDPRRAEWLVPVALGLAGLWLAMYPTLASGLGRIQSDTGDTRFVIYLLEHSWRWLTGDPLHRQYWSPPFFYPARNVAAYAETMLSVAPLYWLLRSVGAASDTAFQLWTMALLAFNYLAGLFAFRRGFGLSPLAASAAAFVFSFAAPRLNQLAHQQLLVHGFTALAFLALAHTFDSEKTPRARAGWLVALSGAVALQLYGSLYLGWFLLLALGVLAGATLAMGQPRRLWLRHLRTHRWAWLAAAALLACLAGPLLWKYHLVGRDGGRRPYEDALEMLPRWRSYLDFGPHSWLYGWLWQRGLFQSLPMEWEHRLGFGLVTSLAAAVGLWRGRGRLDVRLVLVTALTLAVLCLSVDGHSLWWAVHRWVPGASGIRAVSRLSLLLLWAVALGLGLAVQALQEQRRWVVLAAVLGLGVAEQGVAQPSEDRLQWRELARSVAARVPEGCEAFLYTVPAGKLHEVYYNLDAMSAALERGLPTLNGYSGRRPPGWELPVTASTEAERARLDEALAWWLNEKGLSKDRVCRVEETAPR